MTAVENKPTTESPLPGVMTNIALAIALARAMKDTRSDSDIIKDVAQRQLASGQYRDDYTLKCLLRLIEDQQPQQREARFYAGWDLIQRERHGWTYPPAGAERDLFMSKVQVNRSMKRRVLKLG